MKKISITKSLTAASIAAASFMAVPAALSAAETDIKLTATAQVDSETARTAEVTVEGVPDIYAKAKIQGVADEVEIKNGKFTCTVSILNADGDISTEPIKLDVTFITESGDEASGILTVKVENKLKPSADYSNINLTMNSIEFDWGDPSGYANKYEDGVEAALDNIPEGIVSVGFLGKEYKVTDGSAKVIVPAFASDVNKYETNHINGPDGVIVPNDALLEGTHTVTATFIDSDKVEHEGKVSFQVNVKNATVNTPKLIEAGTVTVDLSKPDSYGTDYKDGIPVKIDVPDGVKAIVFNGTKYTVSNGTAKIFVPSTQSGSKSFETDYAYKLPDGYALPDDVVREGDYEANAALLSSNGKDDVSTDIKLTYSIKWENAKKNEQTSPKEDTYNLDFNISAPVISMDGNLKKSDLAAFISKYSVGAEIELKDLPEIMTSVTANGKTFNVSNRSAKIQVPVIDDKGNAFNGKLPLEFKDKDSKTYSGSITYSSSITEPAPDTEIKANLTFDTNVIVKVNGNVVSSGATVSPGDVLEFSVQERRGQTASVNITADGSQNTNRKMNSDGSFDKYTVPKTSKISVATVYSDKASYTISLGDCISATVIGDSASESLKNGDKIYDGERIKINVNAPSGYTLNALKLNGSVIQDGTIVTVNGTDMSVTADFSSIAKRTITFPEDVTVIRTQNSTEIKTGVELAEGEKIQITAAKQGYVLTSLKVNGMDFVNGSVFTIGSGNVNITTEYSDTASDATVFPVVLKIIDTKEESAIKNVTIEVINSNGVVVATAVSDKKGKVNLDLAPGKYTYRIKEAPDGYVFGSNTRTFSISSAGVVRGSTSYEISLSKITISRTDSASGSPVAGATIAIKNSDGETVFTGKTGSTGQMTVEGLVPGKYTYREKMPAAGYAPDTNTYSFVIAEDGSVSGTFAATCKANDVILSINDADTGKGLPGITLVIKNSAGATVTTVKTDEYGKAVLAGLTTGNYTMEQTTALDGYTASSEVYTFYVTETGAISGTTSIINKAKVPTPDTSSSVISGTGNNIQSDTIVGDSTIDTGSTTGNQVSDNTASPSTSTGTISGNSSEGKIQTSTTTHMRDVIKTGVETPVKKSKAPVIAAIVGGVAALGGVIVALLKKFKNK